jgi:multiple sugar transport system permease protein
MRRSSSRLLRRTGLSTLSMRLWDFTGTALVNLFIFIFLLLYLSPMSYMLVTSLKSHDQLSNPRSPIWPADAVTYEKDGKSYLLFKVPLESGTRVLALYEPHTSYSMFIDPADSQAQPIRWEGSWRKLEGVYRFTLHWENFVNLWNSMNYNQLFRNTLIVVGLGELGILLSSIAVAYGFSRFRIPGGKFLFFLLIATIMVPDSITLVPSYFIYARVLKWSGSFLPLIVPQFFGSAIYIFLLRQNFKSIPRDLDEAAMLDGAGPLRILVSIVLPQAVPVVVTVALLQFFNAWNELRMASLYLSTRQDLRTIAFSAQAFQSYGFTPEMLQASAVVLMIVPVVFLFLAQRFFIQDMVVTGLEK